MHRYGSYWSDSAELYSWHLPLFLHTKQFMQA